MTKKEGPNGMIVSSEIVDNWQNLRERLDAITDRLQKQNVQRQTYRLQELDRQTAQILQELQSAKRRTSEAEAAQVEVQQQITEAEQLLQKMQDSQKALLDGGPRPQEQLQALKQQENMVQVQLVALQHMNEQTDEELQANVEAFDRRYKDWVEKMEMMADDLAADNQILQGLKKSDFLSDETAWGQVYDQICALTEEVEKLRTLLNVPSNHS